MATFKVGDRVRLVRSSAEPQLVGREATITAIPDRACRFVHRDCSILVDGAPSWIASGEWGTDFDCIVPLTPPAQDEWADAKVREVTKPVYTEPERVKERAHG